MANLKVVTNTCDRCHREVNIPLAKNYSPDRNRLILPDGWLHVSGMTNIAVEFTMDLCGECKDSVLAAAGAKSTGYRARPPRWSE